MSYTGLSEDLGFLCSSCTGEGSNKTQQHNVRGWTNYCILYLSIRFIGSDKIIFRNCRMKRAHFCQMSFGEAGCAYYSAPDDRVRIVQAPDLGVVFFVYFLFVLVFSCFF